LSLSFSDDPILLFMNSTLDLSLTPSLSLYISLYLSINNILYLIVSFVKCWNNNESWSSEVHAAHTSIYLGRSDDLNFWNDFWFRACEKQIIEKGCPRIEILEAKKFFSQEMQTEKKVFLSGNIANWNNKLKLLVFLSCPFSVFRNKKKKRAHNENM
jgi:hypothetical protein